MNIKLDGSLIAIFLIFWVTFVLLKKLYFDPYKKAIEERENFIKERNEREARALSLYEERASEIKATLEEVRVSTLEKVKELRRVAMEEKARRLEKMREELAKKREEYKKGLEAQLAEARKKIKGMAEWMAEEIERRLI